jgi:hypothetical protein
MRFEVEGEFYITFKTKLFLDDNDKAFVYLDFSNVGQPYEILSLSGHIDDWTDITIEIPINLLEQKDYGFYFEYLTLLDSTSMGWYVDDIFVKKVVEDGEDILIMSMDFEDYEDGDTWYVNWQIEEEVLEENQPPLKPVINGPSSGKLGVEYEYEFSTIDPDGDEVYYWILWFEGCPGVSWDGPYNSGEILTKSYIYYEEGDYTISVKAKDSIGDESEWSTFEVSMPKQKIKNRITILFYWLFELLLIK